MHCKLSLSVLKIGKSVNWPYLVIQAKNEKTKGTFFSWTLKVEEKKVVLFYWFLPYRPRYCPFFYFFKYLGIVKKINYFVKKLRLSEKSLFWPLMGFCCFLSPSSVLENLQEKNLTKKERALIFLQKSYFFHKSWRFF